MPSISKELRDYREGVLPDIIRRYQDGEDLELLAHEYDWGGKDPVKSLYYYFNKHDVELRGDANKGVKVTKEIRNEVAKNLSAQSRKMATIALTLGGTIANRYLPLIDFLIAQGSTLEGIAMEIMDWYEMKEEVNRRLMRLEAENAELLDDLHRAYEIAQPNYRASKRQELLAEFYKELLKYKAVGLNLPYRPIVQQFYTALYTVDDSLEAFRKEAIVNA
jgi:hypothetical protein